ncbi:unnamed protein product [Mytilus coruscus]|uniref:B box-type domain-containing protein n=1 Tax=Mytilus coruscus TaxID=42192 RepID=A0A6J8A3M6_MYTCO|nr:unnamed protein product [Mytilus coruscus]
MWTEEGIHFGNLVKPVAIQKTCDKGKVLLNVRKAVKQKVVNVQSDIIYHTYNTTRLEFNIINKLQFGQEMAKSLDMFCGTCDRRSRSTKAIKYCTDCEDGFCSECLDFHGSMKVSTSHHVIDINAVDGIGFNISKFCKVHPDMVLEYFCSDHDTL